MKSVLAAAASSAVLVVAASVAYPRTAPPGHGRPRAHAPITRRPSAVSNEALTTVVRQTCGACHNERSKAGNLVLQTCDVANAASTPDVAEKMIAKLRAGMMPPPGRKRPGGDTLTALAETLERLVDRAAALRPEPGTRSF